MRNAIKSLAFVAAIAAAAFVSFPLIHDSISRRDPKPIRASTF